MPKIYWRWEQKYILVLIHFASVKSSFSRFIWIDLLISHWIATKKGELKIFIIERIEILHFYKPHTHTAFMYFGNRPGNKLQYFSFDKFTSIHLDKINKIQNPIRKSAINFVLKWNKLNRSMHVEHPEKIADWNCNKSKEKESERQNTIKWMALGPRN